MLLGHHSLATAMYMALQSHRARRGNQDLVFSNLLWLALLTQSHRV